MVRQQTRLTAKNRSGGALMLIRWNGLLLAAGAAAVAAMVFNPARAEDAVKIGLILPMTGGQASTG
jgi:branched-chain amino acid transport system substrate-binding protein